MILSSSITRITVPTDIEAGMRLDQFLIGHFPETGRKFWKENLAQAVRLNGRRGAPGDRVLPSDQIEVSLPCNSPWEIEANPNLELKVLFEDAWLLAVDKPAGLPCHPYRSEERNTVVNAMVARFPELQGLGASPREAGLIHRLDNETTGVLLFARSAEAWEKFSSLNRRGKIDKYYLAWVEGRLSGSGRVELAIAHHPKKKRRMIAVAGESAERKTKARPALSEYEAIQSGDTASLLRVKIHRGNRHQIRVHLASLGHPILGDKLYGEKAIAASVPRHLLHAERVEFEHPFTGENLSIESPRPADFQRSF